MQLLTRIRWQQGSRKLASDSTRNRGHPSIRVIVLGYSTGVSDGWAKSLVPGALLAAALPVAPHRGHRPGTIEG